MFSENQQLPVASRAFVTNDPAAECDAIVADLGIGQLASYLALPHVRAGRLVTVLENETPEPTTLTCTAQQSSVAARVRLGYEKLLEALGRNPDAF